MVRARRELFMMIPGEFFFPLQLPINNLYSLSLSLYTLLFLTSLLSLCFLIIFFFYLLKILTLYNLLSLSHHRVVYFSIHRYESGQFWPNLRESDFDYIGIGKGAGYNFNIPLNKTGMGNADYLAIFQHLIMPVALEVNFLFTLFFVILK